MIGTKLNRLVIETQHKYLLRSEINGRPKPKLKSLHDSPVGVTKPNVYCYWLRTFVSLAYLFSF